MSVSGVALLVRMDHALANRLTGQNPLMLR